MGEGVCGGVVNDCDNKGVNDCGNKGVDQSFFW